MSAESSWNRNSSVRGIDYLWTYRIDFFQISVALGHTPERFTNFQKKKTKNKQTFSDFLAIFFYFR